MDTPTNVDRMMLAAAALPVAFSFFEQGYCGTDDGSNVDQVAEVAVSIADAVLRRLAQGLSSGDSQGSAPQMGLRNGDSR